MKQNLQANELAGENITGLSRRKAVKTLVGGAAAFAAYNVLPTKWGSPIIEQIFLPAHAATSGQSITNLTVEIINGDPTTRTVDIRISGQLTPAEAGATVNLTITPSP